MSSILRLSKIEVTRGADGTSDYGKVTTLYNSTSTKLNNENPMRLRGKAVVITGNRR